MAPVGVCEDYTLLPTFHHNRLQLERNKKMKIQAKQTFTTGLEFFG
jgi:hypothetical protein